MMQAQGRFERVRAIAPPLSEDALADLFSAQHGENWNFVEGWGRWLGWDGVRWRIDDVGLHRELIRQVCREAALRAERPRDAQRLASQRTISCVERIARSDPRDAARPEDWDAHPNLLNTPSGVLDLATGELLPHNWQYRLTRLAGAHPHGDCPRWSRFIDEITGGDRDLAAYLQRVAGYCLTGGNPEQVFFFFHGSGANGKSVYTSVLTAVLGDYATPAPLDTFMATHGDRHPTDLAGLRGARMVTVAETEQGRDWAESRLKTVTGGDRIKARFVRQDFFEFEPQFKLIVLGNQKPALRSAGEAMRRRLHLVPFTVTFAEGHRDLRLVERLKVERNGILRWALTGCIEVQRRGLAPPAMVLNATREYFEEEDAIADWLVECCHNDAAVVTRTRDLFRSWIQFAEGTGTSITSQKALKRELVRRGYHDGRTPSGQRGVCGIALRTDGIPAGGAP